ncbi:MAG: caspase family protein [Gemmatimonadaceae bacterium]
MGVAVMDADPKQTFAVVVGIESYTMKCAPLDGPAPDACNFVNWLRKQEVPADNIKLFLSPINDNKDVRPEDVAFANPAAATQANINEALVDWAHSKEGDLFIVFWGGHGVSDDDDNRALFYTDATDSNLRNLNLSALLQKLRASSFRIRKQLYFVDSCGSFARDLGVGLPKELYGALSGDLTADSTRQSVFFAAGPGQVAKNITAEKTGMFARALFNVLKLEHSFPPDVQRVADGINEEFRILQEKGSTRQIPGLYDVLIAGRKHSRRINGAPQEDRAIGPLVPKLYDRIFQDGDFWSRFQNDWRTKRVPQIFFLFGEVLEEHRSLVTRLVELRIKSFAESEWGDADGTVRQINVDAWPNVGSLERRKTRIPGALAAASASRPTATNNAREVLSEVPGFSNYKVLVVSQQIAAETWSPDDAQLLQWYLDQFWNGTAWEAGDPTPVLFLQFVCAEEMFASGAKAKLFSDLEAMCDARPSAAIYLLDELLALSEQDLRNWFDTYIAGIAQPPINSADEAQAIYAAAKTRRDKIRRTDYIETQLTETHEKWTQQVARL